MPRVTVTQVADGVHLAETGLVNWVLLVEDDQVSLVDTGYPGDADRVEESLAAIGNRVEDVAAILVTHAHVDHVGSVERLLALTGAPVLMSEEETRHARRDYLQQATETDVARAALRNPRVLPWALRIMRLGATKDVRISAPRVAPPGVPLDVPGRPVLVPTPGHTSGHAAYSLPAAGAVCTGDALVTGHATTGRDGPQLLPGFFTHDAPLLSSSLDAIAALDADIVLPGHGPVWRGPAGDAVARARGTRR